MTRIPFCVLVAAVYPLLHIATANPGQVDIRDVALASAVGAVAALALLLAARLATSHWSAAALVALVGAGLFFAVGSGHSVLELHLLDRIERGDVSVQLTLARLKPAMLLASALAMLLAIHMVRRLSEPVAARLVSAANVGALALVAMVWPGLYAVIQSDGAVPNWHRELPRGTGATGAQTRPDVYYIVLDGYARADTLARYFDFDNSQFIDGLEERGFEVASAATTNYFWTFLSLSSSLNLGYLQDLFGGQISPGSTDRSLVYRSIRDSELARILRSRGYRFVHLQSTWGATARNSYADSFLRCHSGVFTNEYFRTIAESSLLRLFSSVASGDLAECHLANLRALENQWERPGPQFVFAHFLPPHHPYLFDSEGKVLRNADLANQFEFQKRLWRRKDLYLGQLQFMNARILEVVDALIKRSKEQPIIVIQSDHGPHLPDAESRKDRRAAWGGILAAVYIPGAAEGFLPEDISPVNMFRLILNLQFGDDLPLLQSRSYLSSFKRPYDFRLLEPEG